jgi:hypothetical protein
MLLHAPEYYRSTAMSGYLQQQDLDDVDGLAFSSVAVGWTTRKQQVAAFLDESLTAGGGVRTLGGGDRGL